MARGVQDPLFWVRRALAALLPVSIPLFLGIPLARAVPLEASLLGFLGVAAAKSQGLPTPLAFLAGGWTYGIGLVGYGAYRGRVPLPLEKELAQLLKVGEDRGHLRATLAAILSLPWLCGNAFFWGGLLEEEPLWAVLGEVLAIGGFFLVAPQVEALRDGGEG